MLLHINYLFFLNFLVLMNSAEKSNETQIIINLHDFLSLYSNDSLYILM